MTGKIQSKATIDFEASSILEIVNIDGESFYKIGNHDSMRPFFMSIVSDSDHWMFISSNGGLSAGRKNSDFALFPYYTDDKITEFADITGSKTIFQVKDQDDIQVWEPFSEKFVDVYRITRNLYKSVFGNKIVFEEINHNLDLNYSYSWNTGNRFGFIKKSTLTNLSGKERKIVLLDGIQNILPYGVNSDLQNASSNLVDAYKRTELHKPSGLGIFALSAIIVDKAEPSEALKANVVWSLGIRDAEYLLSSVQLDRFRRKHEIESEYDVKGEKGAYFISKEIVLSQSAKQQWSIIADVNKNHSQIIRLCDDIVQNNELHQLVSEDIHAGTQNLIRLVASADGIQHTGDPLQDGRHFSNVLFNIMRGGIFDDNYVIDKKDFVNYLYTANKKTADEQSDLLKSMPHQINHKDLISQALSTEDPDLIRLTVEYLPLKFSRRHGDPSRPWNKFSINLRNEKDGSKILDYEGNWRDIFQNWEALAMSFPEFTEGMLFKFLNASTFDGYNPYRVTKDGFDWETIEPDDPWSYIGYWGDHQIIYLQKFLEIIDKFHPDRLQQYFDKDWFVYAAVPYIIKSYDKIVHDPKDTIDFDHEWDTAIRNRRMTIGADGALLRDSSDAMYHVNFLEKILATLLAKISNFIPEGGIWLNTQRPEWNDANNALVGNGVSMVTLYYMRRCMHFLLGAIQKVDHEQYKISGELIEFYHSVRQTLETFHPSLDKGFDDALRKEVLDQLGKAASDYRQQIYKNGFWGKKRSISREGLIQFLQLSLDFTDQTIDVNQRQDKMFHAYNLMSYSDHGVRISHLDEMLEGQVAVLSSGYLSSRQAVDVLNGMKESALFRPDQYSYILYPNKNLPGFLEKNMLSKSDAEASQLLMQMVKDGNTDIIEKDIHGQYHFNGNFKNAGDLRKGLDALSTTVYGDQAKKEEKHLLLLFEKVFNHKAFTGRSGTFFAYEGLGSVYWHMVSKLLLATQECGLRAIYEKADDNLTGRIMDHYYEIRAGIGVHKSPKLYGAFPTDPYSHTPMHKGAQQPGMTGQVKEDILSRWAELGVGVIDGKLGFSPVLLRKDEFTNVAKTVFYIDMNGHEKTLMLNENQLFFTYCHVPVVYEIADRTEITISENNGKKHTFQTSMLDVEISKSVFERSGRITQIQVLVDYKSLK